MHTVGLGWLSALSQKGKSRSIYIRMLQSPVKLIQMAITIHHQEHRLKCTIYVTNLPEDTTYGELRYFFAKHGTVLSTYINSKGISKRQFGLVTFQDLQVALSLISIGKLTFWGSLCYISERRNPHDHAMSEIGAIIEKPVTERPLKELGVGNMIKNTGIQAIEDSMVAESGINLNQVPMVGTQRDVSKEPKAEPANEAIHHQKASEKSAECGLKETPISYKKVVRVEGVPHDWDAYRLFEHLVENGVPITACLVYDDYDEHGSKQGMIQLPNPHSAQRLCEKGLLQTNMVILSVVRSALASISPIRRSYIGKYTAYSYDEEPIGELSFTPPKYTSETYSYSVAEPFEPQEEARVPNVTFGLSPIMEWPSSPPYNSNSPGLDDDRVTSVTPMSMTSNEYFHASKATYQGIGREMGCSTGVSALIANSGIIGVGNTESIAAYNTSAEGVDHATGIIHALIDIGAGGADAIGVAHTGNENVFIGVDDVSKTNHGATEGVFKSFKSLETNIVSFQPGIVLPKPSTTVIIDNLSKSFTKDARSVAVWMQQFGEVRTSDLVPVSKQCYRAYISFWHPYNADLALRNLVRGDLVMHQFQVRLA